MVVSSAPTILSGLISRGKRLRLIELQTEQRHGILSNISMAHGDKVKEQSAWGVYTRMGLDGTLYLVFVM